MAIDRIDQAGVAYDLDADAPSPDAEPGAEHVSGGRGLALSSARTALLVVLAVIGILVVLPAAIAAQAAIGI